MIFDPYKAYQAGRAGANVSTAQKALEDALMDLGHLTGYDASHPLYGGVRRVLSDLKALKVEGDPLWNLARPGR